MTRKEEIREAALKRDGDCDFDSNNGLNGFIEGAEWADAHQPSPWISVEDRLPEEINKFLSAPVLCRYTRGSKEFYHVCQYDYEFDEWQISKVTHWMPIPNLPKGGNK